MSYRGTLKDIHAVHAEQEATVLRALRHGPLDGAELRDEVAARIKRDAMSLVIDRLRERGLVAELCRKGWLITWRITDTGRTALKEAA